MLPSLRLPCVLALGAALAALAAPSDGGSEAAAEDAAGCPGNRGGACMAEPSEPACEEASDSAVFMQRSLFSAKQQRLREDRSKSALERIEIVDGAFQRGGKKVKPLGGNWAIKARPYFAPLDVVRKNAQAMAAGAKSAAYAPTDGSEVVPVVRLAVFWEAAMPLGPSAEVDEDFARQLDETIKAFASEGVYVFLDNHQDVLSTTNGGEGFPWWVAANMQETDPAKDYIVSPQHPLSLALPEWLRAILLAAGVPIPVPVVAFNSTDPWRPYSVGSGDNPELMNIGNPSMRANNADSVWVRQLEFSYQVQNLGMRFFASHSSAKDKTAFFDPFVRYILHLTDLWEQNPNVIAVGLMNEPPITGVPSLLKAMESRGLLWDFYTAVVRELFALRGSEDMLAPISVEEVAGGVAGGSPLLSVVAADRLSSKTLKTFRSLASRNQLVFEYHYYPGPVTKASFQTALKLAREEADLLGGAHQKVPVYLSEYWVPSAQEMADVLVIGSETGCDAVTYWQYADLEWTGTDGWYKYPESVKKLGGLVSTNGTINEAAWEVYAKTVRDGTSWGASITGGTGAQMGVLAMMPAADSEEAMQAELASESMGDYSGFGHY